MLIYWHLLFNNRANKLAGAVAEVAIEMLQPFKALIQSITADNGLVFVDHQRIVCEFELMFNSQIHMRHTTACKRKCQLALESVYTQRYRFTGPQPVVYRAVSINIEPVA